MCSDLADLAPRGDATRIKIKIYPAECNDALESVWPSLRFSTRTARAVVRLKRDRHTRVRADRAESFAKFERLAKARDLAFELDPCEDALVELFVVKL